MTATSERAVLYAITGVLALARQCARTASASSSGRSSGMKWPLSQKLSVVELPADTVPYAWAPEIAGLAGPSITEKTNYRLLANAIAHQWWGASVSPATKDDWWVIDGFSRYSEAM